MKSLIALIPICHGAYVYEPGDKLPEDPEWTDVWIASGAAAWKDVDEQKAPARKAIPVTAEPGVTGLSTTGNPEDLIGKVPKDPIREKPQPRKKKNA